MKIQNIPARNTGMDPGRAEEILRVFRSDNYLSLMPGQRRVLTAELATGAAIGYLAVMVDGWNTKLTALSEKK